MADKEKDTEFTAIVRQKLKTESKQVIEQFIAALDNEKKDGVITPSEATKGFTKALDILAKADGKTLEPREKPTTPVEVKSFGEGIGVIFKGLGVGLEQTFNGAFIAGAADELGLKIDKKAIDAGIASLHHGVKPNAEKHEVPKGELPPPPAPVAPLPAKSVGLRQ
jgi:hypothetical protein